jgi:nitrogen regulatory protein PII
MRRASGSLDTEPALWIILGVASRWFAAVVRDAFVPDWPIPRGLSKVMELLVCVINREERLDEILSGFLELGITGATVVNSEGMGRLVTNGVPVVAGLQSLLQQSRPHNTMIFSVIDSPEKLQAVIDMLQGLLGELEGPGTGIVFTVPVSRVVGLADELPSGSE